MKQIVAFLMAAAICLSLFTFAPGAAMAADEEEAPAEPRRVAMFGDSVLAGQLGGKPAYTLTKHMITDTVAQELGVEVKNFAKGSMGWISKQYLNISAEEYVRRVSLDKYDTAVFMYGLNDGRVPLGTDMATDETTILGAVDRTCEYLLEHYPTLQIILCTPTPSRGQAGTFPEWGFTEPHEAPDGWTFEMMRDEFRLFCDYYHIPLIEGDKCFNSWNLDTLMGDHVHPNEEGYIVAGRYLAAQLSAYI